MNECAVVAEDGGDQRADSVMAVEGCELGGAEVDHRNVVDQSGPVRPRIGARGSG